MDTPLDDKIKQLDFSLTLLCENVFQTYFLDGVTLQIKMKREKVREYYIHWNPNWKRCDWFKVVNHARR